MVSAVLHANGNYGERLVKIHRVEFERLDREGVMALVRGNATVALENFRDAARHASRLSRLLHDKDAKKTALDSSIMMSERVAKLRELKNKGRNNVCTAVLDMIEAQRS